MNGFAALDIHPHRRYVVDIGGRRSSRCRLHINFALFLHSLDFTQNLGVTHNGGDFFNEILFGHPNLPALDSVMMSSAEQTVRDTRRAWRKDRSQIVHSPIYPLLYPLNSFTEKDFFVVFILTHASGNKYDPASRIVPALLFQPHFPNRVYEKHNTEDGKRVILFYGQYNTGKFQPNTEEVSP